MTKEDGSKYYAYLVVYVDNVLCCDVDPSITMKQIQPTFCLKMDTQTLTYILAQIFDHGPSLPVMVLRDYVGQWAQAHMSKKQGGYVTGWWKNMICHIHQLNDVERNLPLINMSIVQSLIILTIATMTLSLFFKIL